MRTKLITLIDNLILDDGYRSYDKLPDDTQAMLTAEMAVSAEDSGFFEVLTESKKSENNVYALIVFLRKNDTDNALMLANQLRENAIDYFHDTLSEMFDDRYGVLQSERNYEDGLHPIVDHVNGETRWVR